MNRASELTVDVLQAVSDVFEYQAWDAGQIEAGSGVRNALASAYRQIIAAVPPCPTRTRALNMLVDARMLANSAITHKGRY